MQKKTQCSKCFQAKNTTINGELKKKCIVVYDLKYILYVRVFPNISYLLICHITVVARTCCVCMEGGGCRGYRNLIVTIVKLAWLALRLSKNGVCNVSICGMKP